MRFRSLAAVLTSVAALLFAAPSTADTRAAVVPEWPQYHGGVYRTGNATSMPTYTGGLHIDKKVKLDGAVYAQPIVAQGLTIVATENDTVYAFDASNILVWKHHLGTPVSRSKLPCGDINPLGISGTPAYTGGKIWVAAEFSGSPTPTHRLYGLQIGSGAIYRSASLDYPGVDPTVMEQRGAIAIQHGKAWVPFGGLAGDCGRFKGRVVGIALKGGRNAVFTVPTQRKAGIWAQPGPLIDSDGNLVVSVGSGAAGKGDKYDFSDSILKISGYTATRLDHFSPKNWQAENTANKSLGSLGPTFVRGFVFAVDTSGEAYVLNRKHYGGVGKQVSAKWICRAYGGTAIVGNTIYVPCGDGIRSVYVDPSGGMHVGWHNSSANGSPVYGGGIVWALNAAKGLLEGIGHRDGTRHVTVNVGTTDRYATPAISGRRILIGTKSGLTVLSF